MHEIQYHGWQRKLCGAGALLFTVGLFTGIWSSSVLSGAIAVPLPRLALAAHLNGLLGGLWLLAVGLTTSLLSSSERQIRWIAILTLVSAWGNWLITLAASWLGVNGLSFGADSVNNTVGILLRVVVVVPGLIAGVLWVKGFCRGR